MYRQDFFSLHARIGWVSFASKFFKWVKWLLYRCKSWIGTFFCRKVDPATALTFFNYKILHKRLPFVSHWWYNLKTLVFQSNVRYTVQPAVKCQTHHHLDSHSHHEASCIKSPCRPGESSFVSIKRLWAACTLPRVHALTMFSIRDYSLFANTWSL